MAALLLMLILNFGMGGQVTLGRMWFLVVISFAPKAVGSILFTVDRVSPAQSVDISFGPAAFFPADASR